MAAGYPAHLANTNAIKQYSGLKYTDDKSDAIWLAKLLRLRLLAEGHIYPKEKRGIRELLRRRMILVRQQTMCSLGIQGMIKRYENMSLTIDALKQSKDDDKDILKYVKDEHVRLAVQSQLKVFYCVMEQVIALEKAIQMQIKNDLFLIYLKPFLA